MKVKQLLYLTLCSILLSMGSAQAAEPVNGIVVLESARIKCSGVNVLQVGEKVYALTATHCLTPNMKLDGVLGVWKAAGGWMPIAVQESGTGKLLGEGKPSFTAGDLAVIVYTTQETVPVWPYSIVKPAFGDPIWGCAVVVEDKQAICFPGLWSGYPYEYMGTRALIATLPARGGFSGGAVGAGKSVIGIWSIRIGEALTGVAPIDPAIPYLEGVKK